MIRISREYSVYRQEALTDDTMIHPKGNHIFFYNLRVKLIVCVKYRLCKQKMKFNPQTANGGLRGPGTHSKLTVPFNFHQISPMLDAFLENVVLNIPL